MATLHYIFDPMCGWCYAVSPLVKLLEERLGSQLNIVFHPGLLFAQAQEIEPSYREHIIRADKNIETLSKVPFGETYIERVRNTTVLQYNSVPPASAIMAVNSVQPASTLRMLEKIQTSHYVTGGDVSKKDYLMELAGELGIGREVFEGAYSVALENITDVANTARSLMQKVGGGGFPTFALEINGSYQALGHSDLYGHPEAFVERVQTLLS